MFTKLDQFGLPDANGASGIRPRTSTKGDDVRTNRGTSEPDKESSVHAITVQAQDGDGFWCIVAEPATVKMAIKVAGSWHDAERVPTRVCVGPDREVRWRS